MPSLQVVVTLDAGGAVGMAGDELDGADEVSELLDVFDFFCTPPWPLQAPRPEAVVVVPSLQVVPPSAEALDEEDEDAAGVCAAAEDAEDFFCMPPCPLQAPRPVLVEVVPSLHVVVAAVSSPAHEGSANAAAIRAVAASERRIVLFMEAPSLRVNAEIGRCTKPDSKPI